MKFNLFSFIIDTNACAWYFIKIISLVNIIPTRQTLLALLKGVLRASLFDAHGKEPLQY